MTLDGLALLNPAGRSVVARLAEESDVDFLVEVVMAATRDQGRFPADLDEADYRRGFAEWTLEQVRGEVPDSTTYVLVEEKIAEPIGRLRVVRTIERVELAGLQLLPRYQSQGIGTAWVQHLLGEAATAGLPFELRVEKDNPRARALYERLGMTWAGETETEDHLIRQPHRS